MPYGTAYWEALRVINQIAGELGLTQVASITGTASVQTTQLVSLLNSAGNELLTYYPWEQFVREWTFTTVDGQEDYTPSSSVAYFTDQTQWDRTNRWPLLGPKSPQEWAWLKGSLVAALPRMRYRLANGKLKLWPIPGATPLNLSMEFIAREWVQVISGGPYFNDMIINDTDLLQYDPWLLIKFTKLKFYELKGFKTTGVQADFERIFLTLTGKDTGADKLNLAHVQTSQYIGPNSVPDGNWNVGP